MRNVILITLSLIVCFAGTAPAEQPLWRTMLRIKHIDADENKQYWLTEENGPWSILAASFAGEGAIRDAHHLVIELRKQHRLEAYMHKQHYDFTDAVRGLGVDKYGAPKKMRHLRSRSFDEIAVLVGNYPAVDDPEIEKTLEKIKYLHPNALSGESQKQKYTSQRMAVLRNIQRRISPDASQRRKGPLGSAFVTRNPLLPKEFFAPSGIDKFVLELNEDLPHSLLHCPGKFSVRVASFRGNVVLDQKKIQQIERGAGMQTRLDEAAGKAHDLTAALRKSGIEAYEFHDRHESIVTVGSFASVGTPRRDGRIEINRAVLEIMHKYGANSTPIPGGVALPGLRPKTLSGIPFDVQPVPVEVPKRSIAADYARENYR